MNFTPLLESLPPIPLHAFLAFAAILLGLIQFLLPKGTIIHRFLGYIWVAMMSGVAFTALFIHEIRLWGWFSPIHLTIPIVFFGLWRAISAARKGNIKRHQRIMKSLFFFALIITGFFTLLPGRVMYNVFFGG